MNRPLPIKPTPSSPITLCITTIAIALLLIPHHHATSQPQLDTITSGTATIQQEATTTTITQTSHSTTLNWNSYNINQGHTITYNQPSTSSIAINNIKDTNPSQILGNINANGRIILLNPNGFYIGPNSTISANTFIAAAANLQQTTYNQNTNTLTLNNPQQTLTGDITLHGTITTTNTTQLIAHHINQNTQATITATNHIALKATHTISLHATHTTTANNSSIDLFANQTITGGGSTNSNTTTITTSYLSLTGDYTATNTTSLTADTILLNHQATITSPTTTIHSTQQSLISATIQSPNTQNPNTQNPNTQGSTTITSDGTITLLNATITTPQQDITIGSTTTPPTQITINQNTTIDTSHSTNPGTIIIYGTNTALYGTILANAITGTGGFIEVSGTRHLTFNPTLIQATSTYGTPGTVLIDPDNIIITDNSLSLPPTVLNLFTSFTAANPGTTITGLGDVVATTDTHVLIANQNFNSNRGNAYLYNIATETWTDLSTTPGQPITSLRNNSRFGASVALNDTYALIGATTAIIAIGRTNTRDVGGAYLYRLDGSDAFTSTCATTSSSSSPLTSPWCTLSQSTGQPITSLRNNSRFGFSVALNDTYALIGANQVASNRGNAYLYRLDGTNAFTSNCATSSSSSSPLTSPWCTLSQSAGQPITSLGSNSSFGDSVALNDTYALIGAPFQYTNGRNSSGDAYLYRLDGTNAFNANCQTTGNLTSRWCTLSQSSNQPITPHPGARFGESVALNDTYALIGSSGLVSNRGGAYLYRLDGSDAFTSTCATTGTLTTPWCTLTSTPNQPIISLATQSRFGFSVALNDTYALIGAPGVSSYRGEAYLYRLDGTNTFTSTCGTTTNLTTPWCALTEDYRFSVVREMRKSGGFFTGSRLGERVALSNTYLVISALRSRTIVQGNAFLFNLDTPYNDQIATTSFISSSQIEDMLQLFNTTITATNDITILSSITYTGPNTLTLVTSRYINSNPLNFEVPTPLPVLDVSNLMVIAAHSIGTSSFPLTLGDINSLTFNAEMTPAYLAHPTDINNLPTISGTVGAISLTQLTGDIAFTTAFTAADLTLIAAEGSIYVTSPLTLPSITSLSLNASRDITITSPLTLPSTTSLSLNASRDITITSPLTLPSTTSVSLITGVSGSIFLTHPTDVLAYFSPFTVSTTSLSLAQTTGDITISSPITLPSTTSLSLTASAGSIFTTLTTPVIASHSLILTAAGNIGSDNNPLIFLLSGALIINAGTNSVFLAHPIDISTYLSLAGTVGSLSLTQYSGDINIHSPINLPSTNFTLTAQAGSITTNLPVTTYSTINAASVTLNASGNIGSTLFPLFPTTTTTSLAGTLTINAGNSSVFLAHPINLLIYQSATISSSALTLTQLTGDIVLTSATTTADLTLIAAEGSIYVPSPLTLPFTTSLSLNASRDITISSSLNLPSIASLTLTAGAGRSVFLTHPTDVLAYLPFSTITTTSLSLAQTTGDITISSPINLSFTSLSLTALSGDITTTLTTPAISSSSLTLNASGNIGSNLFPLFLATTDVLFLEAGTNAVYLTHPTDISFYLSANIVATSLFLTQTQGDVHIIDPIVDSQLSLEIRATGTNASISIQNNITADTLTLFATNTITTTSSNHLITAPTISLQTMQGDIGTTTNRIYLSSGENNPPFTRITLIALTSESNIYVRANQNADSTAFNNIMELVIDNNPNPTSTYTVTIFNDATQAFSEDNDLRFIVGPVNRSPIITAKKDEDGFLEKLTNVVLGILDDSCDNDESDVELFSDTAQMLC